MYRLYPCRGRERPDDETLEAAGAKGGKGLIATEKPEWAERKAAEAAAASSVSASASAAEPPAPAAPVQSLEDPEHAALSRIRALEEDATSLEAEFYAICQDGQVRRSVPCHSVRSLCCPGAGLPAKLSAFASVFRSYRRSGPEVHCCWIGPRS